MESKRQREVQWIKTTDFLRKEEKIIQERIRSMKEKERHHERERQERQHQLEI